MVGVGVDVAPVVEVGVGVFVGVEVNWVPVIVGVKVVVGVAVGSVPVTDGAGVRVNVGEKVIEGVMLTVGVGEINTGEPASLSLAMVE